MINLEGYRELQKLAEGPERIIYSALRISDEKPVVLKALRSEHPSAETIALFYHDYEVSKDLNLPGVIQTYDLVDQQNQYVLVQEGLGGISLLDYLQKNPLKDVQTFLKLAIQLTHIVGDLHQHQIIHKDIKPSSFIIDPKTLIIKITDFNYSTKLSHESQEVVSPSVLEGTLAYMAPEQTGRMNMNTDYRCDFYSLGITFYQMLSGELPFSYADPLELLYAHLANPVPIPESRIFEIPAVLAQLVQKLMAKNPADRYQSSIGIQADLERCQKELENKGMVKTFPLGIQDIFDRLTLSQKLYGREAEVSVLLETYERVSQGAVEALMICGYSGIGKTMLISEVHKPMLKHKSFFVSGKCDQLEHNTPYRAISQALNQLARHILAEPEAYFESIKKDITSALGKVAQVIIDLSPDFELILGTQQPLTKLTPQEAQNRMMIFFKRFLHVVATQEHPLVLFIDDLQWVDSGTLKLFEYILTDDELKYVLLIGAYRENEVDEYHPLQKFFNDMRTQKKVIHSLALSQLTPMHFQALFRDSFNREAEVVKPFSDLIWKRTEGNPFFCKQVINTLYKEKLLYFDYERRRWDWDFDGILALKITDNVVDLMINKLAQLPRETQELLQYAACMGNRFTIGLLMLVSGESGEVLGKRLWPALKEELILALRMGHKRIEAMSHENLATVLSKEITYQFIHDRVQQVTYQGISANEKQKIHLKIARILMEKESEISQNERIFEVVDHFNQAHGLLENSERLQVANLNYEAGRRALRANAYQTMMNYLTAGLSLGAESWWNDHYDIIFKLNLEYSLGLTLLGKIEESKALVERLLILARNPYDQVSLYRCQIINYKVEGKIESVVQLSQAAGALLGVKFVDHPTRYRAYLKLLELQWRMRGINFDKLDEELPVLKNPSIEDMFGILNELIGIWGCKSLISYLYASIIAFELMVRYGKSEDADKIVMHYGIAHFTQFHNVDFLFRCHSVAKRLSTSGECDLIVGLLHIRFPFEVEKEHAKRGFQTALESGDIFSMLLLGNSITETEASEAKSIKKIIKCAKKDLNDAVKAGVGDLTEYLEMYYLLFESLFLGIDLDSVKIHALDQVLMKSEHLFYYWSARKRTFYYYFTESYDKVIHFYKIWCRRSQPMDNFLGDFDAKTTLALTLAESIPHVRGLRRWSYQKRFRQVLKALKWISKESPGNYLHQYLLVKGAKARLKRNYNEALAAFNEAIEHAKGGDFYLWVAVGNELAGAMLMAQRQPRCAVDYILEAHYYYQRYGLTTKVKILEKRYPQCFAQRVEIRTGAPALEGQTFHAVTTTSTTSASLDFMSVIKASQAISDEIIIDKLFEKMLFIVIENSGSETALFLERNKENWVLVASLLSRQGEKEFEMLNETLQSFEKVPQAIIQYAFRSQEPVVLDNAAEDTHYRHDNYIVNNQPKSVLCLPVLYHDRVLGVIYLENNLTIGAFTQDRVTVLTTLSSQIAISIENSRYLAHMENLYHKTERFVPKQFLEIIHKKNIEEVALGDSAKQDISVLFNDIRSFTTLVENRSPEDAFAFVNRYWKFMAPVIRKHGGYIDQYQGDAILAIFPNKPQDAVLGAIAMMKTLTDFNRAQKENNDVAISMGIGISTGPAMLGVIGEEERQVSGLISDVANTAARIEGLNKSYGSRILLSDATTSALPENFNINYRRVDKVRLKGKKQVTEIYEVIEWENELKNIQLPEYLKIFSKAFEVYQEGDFKKAESIFSECSSVFPEDKAAVLLRDRCQSFLASGIPPDWDGAFLLTSK